MLCVCGNLQHPPPSLMEWLPIADVALLLFPAPLSLSASSVIQFHLLPRAGSICPSPRLSVTHFHYLLQRSCLSSVIFLNLTIAKISLIYGFSLYSRCNVNVNVKDQRGIIEVVMYSKRTQILTSILRLAGEFFKKKELWVDRTWRSPNFC